MSEPTPNAEPVVEASVIGVTADLPNFEKLLRASKALLFLRGLIFLFFGGMMLVHPAAAITLIVIVLGVYILFESGTMFHAAFCTSGKARTMLLVNAIALLLLGFAAVIAPVWMGEFAVIFFGVWQLMTGIQCLLFPASTGVGKTGTILSGILAVLVGLFFIGAPLFGLLFFSMLFAVLFFVSGALMLAAGFALR